MQTHYSFTFPFPSFRQLDLPHSRSFLEKAEYREKCHSGLSCHTTDLSTFFAEGSLKQGVKWDLERIRFLVSSAPLITVGCQLSVMQINTEHKALPSPPTIPTHTQKNGHEYSVLHLFSLILEKQSLEELLQSSQKAVRTERENRRKKVVITSADPDT